MTDEDKLYAIDSVLGNEWNVSRNRISHVDAIARIRKILDGPPPVMEWHIRPDGDEYAEPCPDVALIVRDVSIPGEETGEPFEIQIRFGDDGLHCYEVGFSSRAAARHRAVDLYRALRGVQT